MSLSKEFCLRIDSENRQTLNERKDDNYRRDSFDDRFCDDLCEDILQYLSLEDKLKLESVSKQFQRTVFQRQNELFINMCAEEHRLYLNNKHRYDMRNIGVDRRFNIRRVGNYYYIEDQSMHSFKALLKKCPNITSIELNGLFYNADYNPDKLNLFYRFFSSIKSVLDNFSIITSTLSVIGTRHVNHSDKINQVYRLIIENCNNLSEVSYEWRI